MCGGRGLLATSLVQPVTPFAFGTYAAVTFVEAVRVGRKEGVAAIPVVWAIFPVLHVSHGLGFASGLVRYGLSPDWSEPERLEPRAPAPSALEERTSTDERGAGSLPREGT